MSDIVDRLRAAKYEVMLGEDAADEIERLREREKLWREYVYLRDIEDREECALVRTPELRRLLGLDEEPKP